MESPVDRRYIVREWVSLAAREADPVYEPGHDRLTLVHYVITPVPIPSAVYLIDPERCIRARELFPRR